LKANPLVQALGLFICKRRACGHTKIAQTLAQPANFFASLYADTSIMPNSALLSLPLIVTLYGADIDKRSIDNVVFTCTQHHANQLISVDLSAVADLRFRQAGYILLLTVVDL